MMRIPAADLFYSAPFKQKGTTRMDAVLESEPHYTDRRFREEQTVFCAEPDRLHNNCRLDTLIVEGCHYDYSDRLCEWDREKHKEAIGVANNSGYTRRTVNWYQAYLRHYYGKPIDLIHIVAGLNHSNGWPYCVFGTRGHHDAH